MLRYRVGLPGWKLAARRGLQLTVRIDAHYDAESGSFWAESPDLDGLAVSGATLDELHREALAATSELLDLAVGGDHHNTKTDLRVRDVLACAT